MTEHAHADAILHADDVAAQSFPAALSAHRAAISREMAAVGPASFAVAQAAWDWVRRTPAAQRDAEALALLLDTGTVFFLADAPASALEPAALAQHRAMLMGDIAAQRRALNLESAALASCGDTPRALELCATALDLARQQADPVSEARVLTNIGVAFIYAGLYAEGLSALDRAVDLTRDAARSWDATMCVALTNIAWACIHTEDFARGLKAARAAIAAEPEPAAPMARTSRAFAECYYARLLLETRQPDLARERLALARHCLAGMSNRLLEQQLALTEGLCEVHAGLTEQGLSRICLAAQALQHNAGAYRDALLTLVKAMGLAGRPDEALRALGELREHIQRISADSATLTRVRALVTDDAELDAAADFSETVLRRHETALTGQKAQQQLVRAQIEQLERLAVTAELRDDSTGEHSYRVGRLAALLAREAGQDEHICQSIELAARLHDIGKIGIPDSILLKAGRLDDTERSMMQSHTTVGAELLAQSDVPHMRMAEEIARHHHEHWAGGGYPAGLAGEGIPLAARITALADVFDALTHARPYKAAWTVDAALATIGSLAGSQFDPRLTRIFLDLVHRLRREHADLDAFLGAAARASGFQQARQRIASALARAPQDTAGT